MKKFSVFYLVLFISSCLYSQPDTVSSEDNESKSDFKWEKPFNIFASAGAAYQFGSQYNVTISPIDNTVQFEQIFPVITRFSLGLVWNPFPDKRKKTISEFKLLKKMGSENEIIRRHLAVALLINIFKLGYSSGDFNSSSPIDVGFGMGYRNKKFLVLGTLDLTPSRTPRKYFYDQFYNNNKPLVLAGSTEPLKTIDIDDNSLFIDKIFISIGIKIAYTFTVKEH